MQNAEGVRTAAVLSVFDVCASGLFPIFIKGMRRKKYEAPELTEQWDYIQEDAEDDYIQEDADYEHEPVYEKKRKKRA